MCRRQARGFVFQHPATPDAPVYLACSMPCQNVIAELTQKNPKGAMPDLTDMERAAIRDARQSLYEALVQIGRAEAFDTATAAEMDSVIEAVWNGLRVSMTAQSAAGMVPF